MDQEYVGTYGSAIQEMYSGAKIDLLNPHLSLFSIEDIAHHLSHICRFTGGCEENYSVAEHSYWCWRVAMQCGWSEEAQLKVLMHDASEACTNDISRPMKIACPEFKVIESRIQRAIEQQFGIMEGDEEMKLAMKSIDNSVLKAEAEVLIPSKGRDWSWGDTVSAPILIRKWRPIRAREEFLKVFDNLYMKAGK